MSNKNNPNRQDTILGGMILAVFAMVAIVAVVFTLTSWVGERIAKNTGSSMHASRPIAPAPSPN